MTDEEILFDFYTVVAQQEESKTQQLKQYDDEDEQEASSPVSVTPSNPMDHNRSKNTRVTADKREFIQWYEAEVGPWPTHQHSTR